MNNPAIRCILVVAALAGVMAVCPIIGWSQEDESLKQAPGRNSGYA